MNIAIFDYRVERCNPVGSCHLHLLRELSTEHRFTVFSTSFENPRPDLIRWVRVPAPRRPLALLYLVFHMLAPLYYLVHRLRTKDRFDVVQYIESNLSFGDICYAHFCHRRFLKEQWALVKPKGLRGGLRWLDHWLHSLGEEFSFRRAKHIVVPSHGLARELAQEYPSTSEKLHVIANPVDTEAFTTPPCYDHASVRKELRLVPDAINLVFVALGHFERKGLPLLLSAIRDISDYRLRLVVVGGEPSLIGAYQRLVKDMGVQEYVTFVGMQQDVRPYLWSADAFVLPSVYEVFPLCVLQAAASGLPIVVTPMNGVEEFIIDGINAVLVERSIEGVRSGLRRLLELGDVGRSRMGEQASLSVQSYSIKCYIEAWRCFYESIREATQSVGCGMEGGYDHH